MSKKDIDGPCNQCAAWEKCYKEERGDCTRHPPSIPVKDPSPLGPLYEHPVTMPWQRCCDFLEKE